MAIRIVIADDHPLFVEGLVSVLRRQKGCKILDRCGNGDEALLAVRKHRPDVLLLDYHMPGANGIEVLRAIKEEHLAVRVVLMARLLEDPRAVEAVMLGVAGIFLKEMTLQQLLQCVRTVHSGGHWLQSATVSRALERLLQKEASPYGLAGVLTKREIEITRLIAQGLHNREIARKLFINEGTVKAHLHNVSDKLHLHGRYAIALYMRDKGFA